MTPRSRLTTSALVLLAIASFGGLSVGIPLVMAQLTNPAAATSGVGTSVVPAVALGYGLLSLAGVAGILLGWRLAAPLVVVSQGVVAVALLVIYVVRAPDWSLLVVATIAGGAAVCTLADARLPRRT
jgi:hypothetical protein